MIIEDDVIIAPNAVVINSVRKGTVVAGIPAKVIGKTADLEYNILESPSFREGYSDFIG